MEILIKYTLFLVGDKVTSVTIYPQDQLHVVESYYKGCRNNHSLLNVLKCSMCVELTRPVQS